MSRGCIIAVVVGCIVLLIAILVPLGSYNTIVRRHEAIDAAWAQVETVLQRRYDLIPNLVNTVKGYAKHERELLENVTRLRSQWAGAGTRDEKVEAASQLEGVLGRLMVVAERYPDLKANSGFLALQDELAGSENRVAVERRRYNQAVQAYNTTIRQFPGVLVAGMGGFTPSDAYFEAEKGAAKAPKVEF